MDFCAPNRIKNIVAKIIAKIMILIVSFAACLLQY